MRRSSRALASRADRPAGRVPTRPLALLAAGVFGAGLIAAGLPACTTVNPAYDAARPHHTPQGFRNRYLAEVSGEGFWRWQWSRLRDGLPPPPAAPIVGVSPDLQALRAPGPAPQATWIGHATVLVQVDGLTLLTDPHFSERASPVSFAGPRRHQPPGVALADLPRIDAVLISHNHYDHLDLESVRALMRQAGGPPRFYVPLGVDRWFAEHVPGTRLDGPGRNVFALDWDETATLAGRQGPVALHFLAVQHWSSRSPWDRMATLWGSWAVIAPGWRFWFSGDLGLSEDSRDIGRRFGRFDLAAIAVGSYEPRWFMRSQHVNPAEAVQVMLDVGAERAIGIHWGTFPLTDEPLDRPPVDLAAALAARGLPADRFTVMRHGETRRY